MQQRHTKAEWNLEIPGKSILCKERSMCKGPENSKDASMGEVSLVENLKHTQPRENNITHPPLLFMNILLFLFHPLPHCSPPKVL
jgi:hypothetical protein